MNEHEHVNVKAEAICVTRCVSVGLCVFVSLQVLVVGVFSLFFPLEGSTAALREGGRE